ncbi:hypothetical protein ABK730_09180 [Klebsiella indica]|uniref:hypothetical protein n=1 Tax=Klebsiella TaxID=570 RepID=UPI00375230CE
MFTFTLLLFSGILNLFTPIVVLSKYKKMAVYILFFYYFGIDYLNYNMGLSQDVVNYVIKSFPDVLMISLLLRLFLFEVHKKKKTSNENEQGINLFFISFLIVSLVYIIYGIAKGNGFARSILDWRDVGVPVLVMFLIVRTRVINFNDGHKLIKFIGFLVILNAIKAIYDYYVFNGNVESSWRYDFLIELNLRNNADYESRMAVYQIIRNGNLRSSGFFVSALEFSFIVGMFFFYYYLTLLNSIKFNNAKMFLYSIVSMIICFLGVYVSQVRTAFIIIVFNIIFYHLCFRQNVMIKFRPKLTLIFATACSLIMFIIIYILGDSVDTSSYGRLAQYIYLLEAFNPIGVGFGGYKGMFDSFYVYGLLTFGLPFLYFIYFFIMRYVKIFRDNIYADNVYFPLVGLIFTAFPVMLLAMSFQHVAGSLYYSVNLLGLFLAEKYISNTKGDSIC